MEIGANWREIQNGRRDASGCPCRNRTDIPKKQFIRFSKKGEFVLWIYRGGRVKNGRTS